MRSASTPDLDVDPRSRDAHVRRVGQAFVTDEAMAALRHDLLSHLTGIGTVSYLLRKHVDDGAPSSSGDAAPARERRGSDLLRMLKEQVTAATAKLQRKFVAPPDRARPVAPLAACAARARAAIANPEGVVVTLLDSGASDASAVPLVALANDVEIEIAMACLLDNAVEATASVNGAGVRVTLELVADDEVAVVVEDAGPGFTGVGAARAFDAFYTTKPGRLGLGLTVARRIAQRWGGAVVVEARETARDGVSNRVTMRLPLARGGVRE